MRVLVAIGLVMLCGFEVRASDADLFPLQRLELGMTSVDLLKAYPSGKTAFAKKDTSGQITEGLVLCNVDDSAFWDSALIKIHESKIQSWSYVRIKDFDRASKSVGAIHKALVRTLGDPRQKKVVHQLVKQGKCRSPLFVWKHGNAIAAFTHSPVKGHKSSQPFICQLTIAPESESLQTLFDVATDEKAADSEIFQEVMSSGDKDNK